MNEEAKFHIELFNSLKNLVAGLGTSKDKKHHSEFSGRVLKPHELDNMYRFDWVSKKAINSHVDEMTRNWRAIAAPSLKADRIKELEKAERSLKVKKAFNRAQKQADLHGGSLIYLGVENTGPPESPLNIDTVKPGSLKFLNVIEKGSVKPTDIEKDDPTAPNYQKPTFYENGKRQRIHFTRVLPFYGEPLSYKDYARNGYWYESRLTAGWNTVLNSQSFADIVVSLAYEAKVDVVNVEGLMKQLAKANGEKEVKERFALADTLKSINNMLLLDEKEKHSRVQTNFSGMEALIKQYFALVSACFDTPVNVFLGVSAPGLNSTGETDRANYYDMLGAKQEDKLDDNLNYFDEIFQRSEFGRLIDGWESTWNPLGAMSSKDKAGIELSRAQRDSNYTGTLPPSVIVKQLKEDGTYSGITDQLIEDLEELEGLEKEGEEEPPTEDPPPTEEEEEEEGEEEEGDNRGAQ
jgi:phage-related protein (TIGR01555 family)